MSVPPHTSRNSFPLLKGVQLLAQTVIPTYQDLMLPEQSKTLEGYDYNVYYPRGKAIHTILLIYGMTISGENDTRLLEFAFSCVRAGLKVVIPHLPGLSDYMIDAGDLARLHAVARDLTSGKPEKLGLVGFSTGGSYALLLAADPLLREQISPVLLFSPIYDVRDVFIRLHATLVPHASIKERDQLIWSQFVIAYRNRDLLKLSPYALRTIRIILTDFEAYDQDFKNLFFETQIKGLNLSRRDDLVNEGPVLDDLSAKGQLANVKSPVFILHDQTDRVVPPQHSALIHQELAARGNGFTQEILITSILEHVEVKKLNLPRDVLQMAGFLSQLFY